MRKKRQYIECVLHAVQVSFVTKRYLKRIAKPVIRDELVFGYYDSSKNCIFIDKDLDDHKKHHTLLHELKHAFDDQVEGLDEEAICNAFATMLMRLYKINWTSILTSKLVNEGDGDSANN